MNELLTSAILGTDNATAPIQDSHTLLIEAGTCALMARAGMEVGRTDAVWSLQAGEATWYKLHCYSCYTWPQFEHITTIQSFIACENHSSHFDGGYDYATQQFRLARVRLWDLLINDTKAVIQGKVTVLPSKGE